MAVLPDVHAPGPVVANLLDRAWALLPARPTFPSLRPTTEHIAYVSFALICVTALYMGRDTLPTAAQASGGGTGPVESVGGCQNEFGHKLPTAFARCHRIGEPGTLRALSAARAHNKEELLMKKNCLEAWAWRRCINTPSARLQVDSLDPFLRNATFKSMLRALAHLPEAWQVEWHPEAQQVLVDFYGRMYVRVVAFDAQASRFAPLLLCLDDLIDTLDEWQEEINAALGQISLRGACVCPQHLGIIGSRLLFEYDADGGWQVLLDAGVKGKTRSSADEVRSKYKYSTVHHMFPLVGDDTILATLENRTFFYPTTATLTAYSVAGLANRAAVQAIDRGIAQEWLDAEEGESERMAVLPAGPPNVDVARMAPEASECYHRCERLEKRMRELAPAPPPPPPPTPEAPAAAIEPAQQDDAPRKKPGGKKRKQ